MLTVRNSESNIEEEISADGTPNHSVITEVSMTIKLYIIDLANSLSCDAAPTCYWYSVLLALILRRNRQGSCQINDVTN